MSVNSTVWASLCVNNEPVDASCETAIREVGPVSLPGIDRAGMIQFTTQRECAAVEMQSTICNYCNFVLTKLAELFISIGEIPKLSK